MLKVANLIFVIVFFTGCASLTQPKYKTVRFGNPLLTNENVEKIQSGMKKEDVQAILGDPFSATQSFPIGEFWTYTVSESKVKIPPIFSFSVVPETRTIQKSITVTFNEGGIVTNISKAAINPHMSYSVE
jgi:outer membrane protein assembly factor BamE (lipoprotein component of BamABCDE complex)